MKKLFSALLSLSLFAGIAAMPTAAADAEFTAEEIRSRSADLVVSEENASYMAIRPAEDNYVNYYLWSSFEGIAVLCEDAAALEGATMGDYTFTLNGSSTAPYGTICVQSYEDMLARLQRQGSYDPSFYEVNIEVPAQFADQTDRIYMLQHPAAQGADFPDDLLNGLMEDERFAIIGITQVVWQVKAFYGLDFTALHLVPEPGCVIDAEALATEEYGSLTYSENRDYWETSYMPLEDAIALCETLEARDDIVFAWPCGEYYPSTEYHTVGDCKIFPLSGFSMNEDDLIEIMTGSWESEATYTPIRPAEDNYVNYYSFDIYDELVVLCEDAALTEAESFEIAGSTFSLEKPDTYKVNYLGYEYQDAEFDFVIPAELEMYADDLYILSGVSVANSDCYTQILSDERFDVLGVVVVHYQRKASYRDGWAAELVIEAEDGYEIDYAALNTEEYGFTVPVENDEGEITGYMAATPGTVAEAIALCEKLEAREDIAFAWPAGSVTGDLPGTDVQYMTIEPMTKTEIVPGDVDRSGTVDTVDAIMALQEYTAVSVMGGSAALTFTQNRSADMDGDSTVTTMDALEILRYYVYTVMNADPVSPDTYFANPDAYWYSAADAQ